MGEPCLHIAGQTSVLETCANHLPEPSPDQAGRPQEGQSSDGRGSVAVDIVCRTSCGAGDRGTSAGWQRRRTTTSSRSATCAASLTASAGKPASPPSRRRSGAPSLPRSEMWEQSGISIESRLRKARIRTSSRTPWPRSRGSGRAIQGGSRGGSVADASAPRGDSDPGNHPVSPERPLPRGHRGHDGSDAPDDWRRQAVVEGEMGGFASSRSFSVLLGMSAIGPRSGGNVTQTAPAKLATELLPRPYAVSMKQGSCNVQKRAVPVGWVPTG